MSLQGQTILFVAPKFFGYEREIADELVRRGAALDILYDRPFNTPLMTAATRFARSMVIPAVNRLYERELKAFGRSQYDAIFVVSGQTLSKAFLGRLKAEFPRARSILYMWDSLANRRWASDTLNMFDTASTFDRTDAARFGMRFRPLFFSKGFEVPQNESPQYDISFVGTAHTDRAKIVTDVDHSLPSNIRRFWYLYLQAPWVFYAYKATNRTFRDARYLQFNFAPMQKSVVQQIFASSRIILDIEHPQQIGLTMRSLETLGASKKLVTTNADIRSYDFFDERNVCVLNRSDAKVPQEFFKTAYVAPSQELYRKYSLEGWMDEVLSER